MDDDVLYNEYKWALSEIDDLNKKIECLKKWISNVATDDQLDVRVSAIRGKTGRDLLSE